MWSHAGCGYLDVGPAPTAATRDKAGSKPNARVLTSAFSPLSAAATAKLISTPAELATFLAQLPETTSLYVDLEGHWLSRAGSLDIITLLSLPDGQVRLIDVCTLQHAAFSTQAATTTTKSRGRPRTTLKSILEDPAVPKYLWDVRNDADALFAHYGIALAGVTDLQLLENVARRAHPVHGHRRRYLRGLARSIETDLALTPAELALWAGTKDRVRALMEPQPGRDDEHAAKGPRQIVELAGNVISGVIPKVLLNAVRAGKRSHSLDGNSENGLDRGTPALESGGTASYPRKVTRTPRHQTSPPPGDLDLSQSVFRTRPLSLETIAYCANDVVHLPALHAEFNSRLPPTSPWHQKVREESARRVVEAQATKYDPFGARRALSPWSRLAVGPTTTTAAAAVDVAPSA
ncbi:ribonuclease H-like domain-containing protein [Microdochium trichocladiopsis]|uniref:Ribonuclease H-like domain-containing protein n=1 Tax=Microdochium trichocladiopsis TaxID=1682393 RepID=A0A9P9BK41_9PEZI|nr:ribonuclease H-like domain-containing protein [Microdochium trichocladiopsis]KAH7018061.1 ribonuclease H-like domain-containing protein [Microdochium trichocladiopsis]